MHMQTPPAPAASSAALPRARCWAAIPVLPPLFPASSTGGSTTQGRWNSLTTINFTETSQFQLRRSHCRHTALSGCWDAVSQCFLGPFFIVGWCCELSKEDGTVPWVAFCTKGKSKILIKILVCRDYAFSPQPSLEITGLASHWGRERATDVIEPYSSRISD